MSVHVIGPVLVFDLGGVKAFGHVPRGLGKGAIKATRVARDVHSYSDEVHPIATLRGPVPVGVELALVKVVDGRAIAIAMERSDRHLRDNS